MDRASIERELRSAEAALTEARAVASAANEAVESHSATLDVSAVATDEKLAGFIQAESDAKAKLDAATSARDNLLRVLSRSPQSKAIAVNEPQADGFMGVLEASAEFAKAKQLAPSGTSLGSFGVELDNRASVIRSLKRGGDGLFAVGEGATGESLIAIDQRLVPPVEIPRRQIRLLDLITVGATDSNLVRYGKQTVRTDAAAPAALASSFANATYTWSTADASVENIGQYVKAPRETLLDVGALQTLVEQQLAYGVLLEAESLIYSGDGTGMNFGGIVTEALAGGYDIVRDTTNESRIAAVHKGITAVRKSLFADPDAVVMHPDDYHSLLVEQSTGSGVFLLNGSRVPGETDTLWGLPVVVTPLATSGQAVVGNFKLGATLWVRSGTELQMSDSNEDDFLKRLITFRAEFRAAFAVQRPHAFCVIEDFA
jgi:HK97 family phage major capsid protein